MTVKSSNPTDALSDEQTPHPISPFQTLAGQVTPDNDVSESNDVIALPSDVYRDFEALKSATKLDDSHLMRKLLKDYQR